MVPDALVRVDVGRSLGLTWMVAAVQPGDLVEEAMLGVMGNVAAAFQGSRRRPHRPLIGRSGKSDTRRQAAK